VKARRVNQYEIVRKAGSGGGGVVYYAQDTRLMRPVILKQVRKARGEAGELLETVLREARLASAIDHPNVCAIYEVIESTDADDDGAYIVMQHIPGRSLEQLISEGPLSIELAISIAMQMADGLAEAHRVGIVHRDLKPANIMITDGGLVKILDFGLAKRGSAEDFAAAVAAKPRPRRKSSTKAGTVAYMAPEQFVGTASSPRSDIFAFGVMLYEMLCGRHPFIQTDAAQPQLARFIQYVDPRRLGECRPEVSAELESIVAKAMEKNPNERYQSVGEMREGLRTFSRALQTAAGLPPEPSSPLAVTGALAAVPAEQEKKTGFFSLIAERFLGEPEEVPQNSIAVLPFADLGHESGVPFYGLALADAISTRLSRIPSLLVRSAGSFAGMQRGMVAQTTIDPVETARKLLAAWILTGTFLHSGKEFTLTWNLTDVRTNAVKSGGTIALAALDLIAIQNEISEQVFASLQGSGHLQAAETSKAEANTPHALASEDYLQARALLSRFFIHSGSPDDLIEARKKFTEVVAQTPDFAEAQSGLGLVHLQYIRNGLGGMASLMAAQKCFERALRLDPGLAEANLFRVQVFLVRGEKESARHGVRHLLEKTPNDFSVHIVAGVILRLDGLYEQAMSQFNTALHLNPANATVVYHHRARIYQYQGLLELAQQEIDKALTLEPRHPLLRTAQGYLLYRQGDITQAVSVLEGVLAQDPDLRLAYPTLAMAYLAAGDAARANALITERTLNASEADCEMAYRLATFFALAGENSEALPWLRKSIYLGNENYPWIAHNPAWEKLRENEDFTVLIDDLRKAHRMNTQRWKRMLAGLPA
jgi:serine/threonine protein kinase/tetratricopeptide (TPR) repeat protein